MGTNYLLQAVVGTKTIVTGGGGHKNICYRRWWALKHLLQAVVGTKTFVTGGGGH